ncbi:hypothetical protein SAMN05421544_1083 [Riemerella columbipharyngis]|uniref:Uncharacterized protein n=1 Tax=Riemerella columbipharyngis TaxID=1071918 RepID=A0A1G7CEK2_9FLAO|nr:hypothetical protein SAMN05421544_1083 [Riemerella columbipharyngis]
MVIRFKMIYEGYFVSAYMSKSIDFYMCLYQKK